MKHYKLIFNLFNKSQKKTFFIIIFLFLILSLLEVLGIASVIPFMAAIFNPENLSSIKYLEKYTNFLSEQKDRIIPIFCLIFFSIFLFKNIFYILTYKYIFTFNTNFRAILTTRVLNKFFTQEFLYFTKNPQGKLVTILNTETKNFCDMFLDASIVIISETIILIAIFTLIIVSGKASGFIIILPILFGAGLIVKLLNKKVKHWASQRVLISEQLATLSQRIFLSIRDIYFSNNSQQLIKKFFSINQNQSKIDVYNSTIQLVPKALLEITGLVILLSIIIYFHSSGVSEDIILSNLTFYFVVAYRAIPSFNRVLIQLQRIKYSKNSLEIIHDILNLKESRILSIPDDNKLKFNKKIKLDNFNFYYQETSKILKNFNLEIKKNEIVGIYGESGSGKSTLLNLITMLIQPNEGKFYLDDKVIVSKNEIRSFQNMISFISQDTFLIEDTIKNNILFYSNEKFDEERLKFSIDFSNLNSFIKEFENGLDYEVGSHSRRISSGQRQRIAIARAIYNLKEILIFDEATNALDEKNENLIYKNILNLKGKKTVIIVSHNLKNLEHCDSVYEIKNSEVEKKK